MKYTLRVLTMAAVIAGASLTPRAQQQGTLWTPTRTAWEGRIADRDQSAAQSQSPVAEGHAAFDRVCKVCHGADARGDAGPPLVPFSREYEELLAIVREGTGQMPPIAVRSLSDDAVSQIAQYLKSLSR